VNTLGNVSHFLGFGLVTGLGTATADLPDSPTAIGFASGAAFLVRTTVVRQLGLFEDFFFLYHEDTAFGWKLRQCGYGIDMVPDSRVAHCYEAPKGVRHYYWLERNRLIVLLCFLRWRTLLLLSPALALMEAGQFLFSLRHGLVLTRLRIWCWFLRPTSLARLSACRSTQQRRRTQSDRKFTSMFTGTLDESIVGSNWLITSANKVLGGWWRLVLRLIVW
jgi:N-acetylglucosaminyl-diphospho-decaprenol L-rhamnosyltransferase